jgi:hypothetical protein
VAQGTLLVHEDMIEVGYLIEFVDSLLSQECQPVAQGTFVILLLLKLLLGLLAHESTGFVVQLEVLLAVGEEVAAVRFEGALEAQL